MLYTKLVPNNQNTDNQYFKSMPNFINPIYGYDFQKMEYIFFLESINSTKKPAAVCRRLSKYFYPIIIF